MKPKLMGVVNVTPDSFSDGGLYLDAEAAIAHGEELVRDGAEVLDVGGESTRPGAEEVSAEEEMARVVPVVRGLAETATVSIDTSKGAVAEAALDAGATVVNDVTALGGFRDRGAVRGAGRRADPDAHAGRPGPCRPTPPTTTSLNDVPARSSNDETGRKAVDRRSRRGADPGSTLGSASARRSTTTSSCCAGWRARELGRPWSSAPQPRASSERSTAPGSATGSAARSPRPSSPGRGCRRAACPRRRRGRPGAEGRRVVLPQG